MWENDQREKTPVCNLDGRILASSFSLFFKKNVRIYFVFYAIKNFLWISNSAPKHTSKLQHNDTDSIRHLLRRQNTWRTLAKVPQNQKELVTSATGVD